MNEREEFQPDDDFWAACMRRLDEQRADDRRAKRLFKQTKTFERAFALARTITGATIDDGYGGKVRLFPDHLHEASERLLNTSAAIELAEERHIDAIRDFFGAVNAYGEKVEAVDD